MNERALHAATGEHVASEKGLLAMDDESSPTCNKALLLGRPKTRRSSKAAARGVDVS